MSWFSRARCRWSVSTGFVCSGGTWWRSFEAVRAAAVSGLRSSCVRKPMLSAWARRDSMSRASTYACTAAAIAASTMSATSSFRARQLRLPVRDLVDDPSKDDELVHQLADIEPDPDPGDAVFPGHVGPCGCRVAVEQVEVGRRPAT